MALIIFVIKQNSAAGIINVEFATKTPYLRSCCAVHDNFAVQTSVHVAVPRLLKTCAACTPRTARKQENRCYYRYYGDYFFDVQFFTSFLYVAMCRGISRAFAIATATW